MKYNLKRNFIYNVLTSAVFFTVIAQSHARYTCDQSELLRCAYPLRVVTAGNTELGFAGNKEELDQLCPSLNSGLDCIDGYTRRCMTDFQRDHFNRLYSGTSMVIQELCQDGPYQEEFLLHAPCMSVVNEYEDCATHYTRMIQDVNAPGRYNGSTREEAAEMQMRTICCSFQEYLNCSENMVKKQCGEETARFTQNFLNRMSSSLNKVHCRTYLPSCLDAISGAISSSEVLLSNWLLIVVVNFSLLLNVSRSRT